MKPIEVQPVMLMYAFGYALGRMTYAVGDVAEALIAHRQDLLPEWREKIVRDIDQAIANGRAGMTYDADEWRRVKAWMEAE